MQWWVFAVPKDSGLLGVPTQGPALPNLHLGRRESMPLPLLQRGRTPAAGYLQTHPVSSLSPSSAPCDPRHCFCSKSRPHCGFFTILSPPEQDLPTISTQEGPDELNLDGSPSPL